MVVSADSLPYAQRTAATDPTERIITHVTITLVPALLSEAAPAPRLVLHPVREERLDRDGRPVQTNTARPTAFLRGVSSDAVEVERVGAPAILWAGVPLLGLMGIGYLWTRKRTKL